MAKRNHDESEFSGKLAELLERKALEHARNLERAEMRADKLRRVREILDGLNDSVTNR